MRRLLDYLAACLHNGRPANDSFQQWQIKRVGNGRNNLLFRANSPETAVVVKFTIRDERRRAWREFCALQAMQTVGVTLAPRSVFLDEERYPLPVVVQTWVDGAVCQHPPQTDVGWRGLIGYYAAIHSITPEVVSTAVPQAFHNFNSDQESWRHIDKQLACIPTKYRPTAVTELVQVTKSTFPLDALITPPSRYALCRVDPNPLNFIRQFGNWFSVDWESSGWGDPAFEIADMMAHPAYAAVPMTRWQWVMALYEELTGNETAVARIQTYYPLMLVWWVVRLTRMLYEIPMGLDERLVARPPNWQTATQTKFNRYLKLAQKAIS